MAASKVRKPVQKRSIQRRARILAAAESIVVEAGTAAATAAAIAQKADLPTSSVYQYFPEIEMVFQTIAEERFERKIRELEALIGDRRFDTWQQLLDVTVGSMHDSYRNDGLYPRLFLGLDASYIVRLGAGSRLSRFSRWFCTALGQRFIVTDMAEIEEPVALSINLIDAPFLRSIALYGDIRPQYYLESHMAVFAYLEERIGRNIGAAKSFVSG